ncbi:MAG TPA: hypothetical protein PKZ12_08555, partial [Smithellaceae bacterium]|nr:hypothetical protein [Smithellaceae bacterium]
YYSLPYQNEVFVIDDRPDQLDVWQQKPPLGYTCYSCGRTFMIWKLINMSIAAASPAPAKQISS